MSNTAYKAKWKKNLTRTKDWSFYGVLVAGLTIVVCLTTLNWTQWIVTLLILVQNIGDYWRSGKYLEMIEDLPEEGVDHLVEEGVGF